MRSVAVPAALSPRRLGKRLDDRRVLRACRPLHECETRRHGSSYGGWVVNPSQISPDSVVYSFGLGEDVTFDVEMVETYGVEVHGFEPDPLALEWLGRQDLPAGVHAHPYGLAASDGEATLHPVRPSTARQLSGGRTLSTEIGPPAEEHEKHVAQVRRLGSIMRELGHDHVDVLKIDIEGLEYEVLDDMLAGGIHPKQLLVEFHQSLKGIPATRTVQSIRKLRAAGYRPFFVSPRCAEISFLG